MMTGDDPHNQPDRVRDMNAIGSDSVTHKPLAEGDKYEAETDKDAASKGPSENWQFWYGLINAGLIHERRWRSEGEDCETLYFGNDADPGETGNQEATSQNQITDVTALIHANVDVLKPLLFSETPQPVVRRRFTGDGKTDETDLMAAEVGQRLATFLLDTEPFDDVMEKVRDDWLITDRGAGRVAYVASVHDVEVQDPETGLAITIPAKSKETVKPRYCAWRRLVMAPGYNWEDMPWIAFETPMTCSRIVERFGQEVADKFDFKAKGLVGRSMAIDQSEYSSDVRTQPDGEAGDAPVSPFDTAMVWEIWNRDSGQVIWWSASYTDDVLDKEDDPLSLEGFFPMPKPLLGTAKGESMTPRPSIKYYENRAKEVDLASRKMRSILKVMSVSGLFPGQMQEEVKKLLDGTNHMIPVESWISLMEKGGANNIIQWLPLQHMVTAIQALSMMREQSKQAMFEASGVSDIMRAQGDPGETATAQQIKGRYAGLRLSDRQRKMATYARDMLRLMIEIALEHFDTEYLADICALDLPMTEMEREMMMLQKQMMEQEYQRLVELHKAMSQAAQQGLMPPPPPPPTPPNDERIPETSWELVHERLRTDYGRKITVTIETQSTILADEQADKEARIEFLSAFATFVSELAPLAGSGQFDFKTVKELLMFGVRGFPKSRTLESMIANLPDEPQGKPQEDSQIAVAKIKAEVDKMLADMESKDKEKDREHELKLKGVDMIGRAAEVAADAEQQTPTPASQGA